MHCEVEFLATHKKFFCSFIYDANDLNTRYQLWDDLIRIGSSMLNPWLVCGDFNNPLSTEDRVGSNVSWAEIEGFRNCVELCGLFDLKSAGSFFTWSNKQGGDKRVLCKLDRMLGNDDWFSMFPDSVAHFHNEVLLDHTPAVLVSSNISISKKSPSNTAICGACPVTFW